ncbi:beta-galactosidase [Enterococcus casseliflavus]|uniref:beta-galactosidase n=1 Tax=Enterococcus casseliflavus TaxID=37734 RepID=UPI001C8CCA1C|nr:beta-galactosidase [Enterococcus casseliflavus]MBS5814455.1 beta-galactosidase [Enterococcus casseliflavus]MBX9116444.1 beta-galactosidase [Enterococcus casseliflavus]MBX9126765.1 beta-galactosidase [Enterococcus casseliflavus]MCD4962363.1 beta-galactosidase [Enterococcus casseliflavus]MDT2973818.1 beta-galactosidase [Enterococcus casseliflavus]
MTKFFDRILFGGDYNPNQWPKEIWEEDIRIFKKASINSATVNVFSWAKIQPSENCYDFEELDQIIEKLSTEGFDIVLATSTAALPAWMFKKYPEVARTDYDGRHHKFGQRHNACPNSLVYQKYAERLATKLAERYGENPQVTCWHINNEYGGECYCDNCEKAFRVWLKDKYHTIEALNKAWNMEFWGHTVYEWDEIVLPNALSEGIGYDKTAFAGISIDYRRFNSDSLLKNYMMERDAIRKIDPTTPITTNLMGTFKGLDYFKWAKEMDLVSWDNYPSYNTPWSLVAMTHDLMRGLKQQPFMLMEQTPSQQNWQPYNSLKKPGQMRAQSYQTIAHGADTIQYFQLRRSVGACEKFHGAVIEHVGHEDTRVFRETAALGAELAQLSDIIGTQTQAQVAVIFDWDNYWALEYTSGPTVDLKYVEQIHRYYRYFYEQNIAVDLVPVDADLSKYKLVAAPVLYMIKEGMQERLTDFVKQGGALLITYMSGIVDQSDNVHLGGYPGPLRELAGIWVEEIDALAPEQSNGVSLVNEELTGTSNLVSDLIHLENAEALAHYTSNFYAEMPAVTKNTFGDGTVYYFGGQLEDQLQDQLFKTIVKETDITPVIEEATKLEIACRENAEAKFFVIINFHEEAQPLPEMFVGKTDLLTGKVLSSEMMLTQYTTYIVKEGRN